MNAEARAQRAFERAFGRSPGAVARAPGRINLIGEHTDYNDGFVLPMAIDRDCVAAASFGGEARTIRIHSDDLGRTQSLQPSSVIHPELFWAQGPARPEIWSAYVVGAAALAAAGAGMAAALFERATAEGLDIAVASDVPAGSGLSSSAALEVSSALAVLRLLDVELTADDLARACQRAEHEYVGVPCGIMDQLVSIRGERDGATLIDCRSREVELIPVPAGLGVVVVDTRVKHSLASGEYAKRRATCEAAARKLGAAALRDVTIGQVRSAPDLTGDERACARHVVTENARTLAAAEAMKAGDGAALGRFMLESHASLRDDYRVSCDELDAAVEVASAQPGVLGSRMTGGGFGGCAIALVESGRAAEVVAGLRAAFKGHPLLTGAEVFTVRASPGAGVIG